MEYIQDNWTAWVFAIIAAVLTTLYNDVRIKLKAEHEKNEAIAAGVQCLLRENIVHNYNKYRDRGYCPIYAKESIKKAYKAYHNLDGNDVATEIYEKLLRMEEEPKGEEEKIC